MYLSPMDTKMKKSPPRAADSVSVFMGDTLDTSNAGSVVRDGLREVGSMTSEGFSRISKSSSIPAASEAEDGTPVAGSLDWLHVAGLAAVVEGHMSEEGLHHVLTALSREVRQ